MKGHIKLYSIFFPVRSRTLSQVAVSLLLLTVALLYGVTYTTRIAHADGGGTSFSVHPAQYDPSNITTRSYFILDSKPDTTVQNGISITNTGATTGTVTLYAVDATTGQNSGLVYNTKDTPRHDVGSWLQLAQQQLTLTAGQSETIPFQISIPKGVRPGQHVGGIVAESITQVSTQQKNTLHINVQSLSIVAVQLNIAGPQVEQLAMNGIQAGGARGNQNLLLNLNNTGTTLLKPYGTLQVLDAQGHIRQNLALKLDTFLPDTTINYPVYIQSHPLEAGTYTVELQLTYGKQHTLYTKQTFTVTQQQVTQVFKSQGPLQLTGGFSSWQYALIVLLLVLAAGSVLFVGYTLCRKIVLSFAKKK